MQAHICPQTYVHFLNKVPSIKLMLLSSFFWYRVTSSLLVRDQEMWGEEEQEYRPSKILAKDRCPRFFPRLQCCVIKFRYNLSELKVSLQGLTKEEWSLVQKQPRDSSCHGRDHRTWTLWKWKRKESTSTPCKEFPSHRSQVGSRSSESRERQFLRRRDHEPRIPGL